MRAMHLCAIAPPSLLLRLAESGSEAAREAARETQRVSERLRGRRIAVARALREQGAAVPPDRPGVTANTVFDVEGGEESALPGRQVRTDGDPPSSDTAVNEAYDNAATTVAFYRDVLGRESIDGRGLDLVSSVHFGQRYDNAFWTGEQMVYGDGGGGTFVAGALTRSLDVIAHELTHGVTQYTANLVYEAQSGALNESFSDVFGILVKQRAGGIDAATSDWLIGEGALEPSLGKALRSMLAPGTAYTGDDQPADMDSYRDLPVDDDPRNDSGGVHINSGIPNRAFAEAARTLGGNAWETVGPVWYTVLTERLRANAQFADAAAATIAAAGERYGDGSREHDAVRGGWDAVKVVPTPDPR
ncbi:metalloprotease [Actinomycetospora sp. NBRC 106378]|nr:metalloprotease [Actinomycetospora sp. NBRC 106378]